MRRKWSEEDSSVLRKLTCTLINTCQWEEARLVGEHLTEVTPQDPAAQVALGTAWLGLNDLQKAEECFRRALELGDEAVENFLLMSHVCACRGDLQGQLEWAGRASERDAKSPGPHFAMADAHLRLGQFKQAAAALKRVLGLRRDEARARRLLAQVYLSMQKLEEAADEFRKALQLQFNDAGLWSELGHTLSRMKQWDKALIAFRRAAKLEPANPAHQYDLGDTYLALGKPETALPPLTKAVQLAPDFALAHYDLGLAFFDLGRYEESAVASEAALRGDPQMTTQQTNLGLGATNNLGLSYLNQGKYEEAADCFQRNLRLLAPTYFNLGLALFKQGRFQEALANFERALELEPGNAEFCDLIGNSYLELGQVAKAKQALEQSIRWDPDCALAHYDLGVVLSRMAGRDKEALTSLKRALALDPDLAPAYYALACLHAKSGKKKLALRLLEQSLDKGFRDRAHIEADADLDGLRDDPVFEELMARHFPTRKGARRDAK